MVGMERVGGCRASIWSVVPPWVPLLAATLASCGGMSERRTGDTSGESGDTELDDGGASFTGGTGAVGNSAGLGGSVSMGATGGASPGGGGTGAGAVGAVGGTGVIGPECRGIRTGMACAREGLACSDLPCGLADAGRRTCHCATNWTCTACDFTDSIFQDPPANITVCTGAEQDHVSCAVEGALCQGAPGGEVCACYVDEEGAQIWDCDKPPSVWNSG